MAIYTRSNLAIQSGLRWDTVTQLSVLNGSSTFVRLLNTDGTITEITGTGLPTTLAALLSGNASGTVSSVRRLSSDGTLVLESITGLNHSLAGLIANISAPATFLLGANDSADGGSLADEIAGFQGNDLLRGGAGTDRLDGGDGNDLLIGGAGADVLHGGAGNDFAGYADSTFGVTVNLETGAALGGDAAGDSYTDIEGLFGSAHADILTGNGGANFFAGEAGNDRLDGGDGDDRLIGGAGADALLGGAGNDTAIYAASTAGVTVNLATGSASGGDAAGDTLTDIEGVVGSASNDALTGNAWGNLLAGEAGNDTLRGGDGDDRLIGGAGADALHGGAGKDLAIYADSTSGVTVNLATGAASGGEAAGDTLTAIEGVVGSAHADTLAGGAGHNVLYGEAGNDKLVGGDGFDFFAPGEGADTVNGAAGANGNQAADDGDWVSYQDMNTFGAGVVLNLSNAALTVGPKTVTGGSALDPSGATDVLIDVERVRGTAFDDTFRGSDTANLLGERFDGQAGNDTINGGAGYDEAEYTHGSLHGVIVNLSAVSQTVGLTTVAAGTAVDGFGDTDTLIGIEGAIGTDFADAFFGGAGNEKFRGLGGSNTVNGGPGADMVDMYVDDVFGGPGATVNLMLNQASGIGGGVSQLSGIEDVDGSYRDDTIIGNGTGNALFGDFGSDTISGGDGNDLVDGGAGADTLSGGKGFDYLSFSYNRFLAWGGVTVNLARNTAIGPDGVADTLLGGFEAVTGTFFADSITGDAGANTLVGQNGNDTLDGGAGIDTVSYAPWNNLGRTSVVLNMLTGSAPNGVNVNLAAKIARNDGLGGVDTLLNIENVIGSKAADTIVGDSLANHLQGLGGTDTLTGGLGHDVLNGGLGADTLVGGAGVDTASYQAATLGVTASLVAPGSNTNEAAGDSYNGIENLTGSNHGDTLTGDGGNNTLTGGAGGDTLHGGGGFDALAGGAGNDSLAGGDGNDTLNGGAGADTVNGGAGTDAASYAGSTAGVSVNLASGVASGGDAVGDTLAEIENLIGSGHADTLTGNPGNNVLNGGLGGDTLTGGAGLDVFVFNTALGAANADRITDFSVADDTLRLENAIFTSLTITGVLSAAAFKIGAAAGDADDRIIYDSTSGALYYDADGTGGIGQVQFATLVMHPAGVTNADLVVI